MQRLHSLLIAIAMFVGVNTEESPSTSTTSIAIAVVEHDVQLEYATAAFVESTVSDITCRIAKANLKTEAPSFVLIATAVLSAPPLSA
jgi:hypothetical protein